MPVYYMSDVLCESARILSGRAGSLLTVYAVFVVCVKISPSLEKGKSCQTGTYQYNASVSLAHSLPGFWLLGTDTEFLAQRSKAIEPVAFHSDDVELVGFDLVHLGWRLGVDKGSLGERHSLPFGFGLLN